MKTEFIKTGAIFLFSALFITSCLRDDDGAEPEHIIDPVEILLGSWHETEKKVGDADAEPITDGRLLTLWSSGPNDGNIGSAHYQYNPGNLGIAVDTVGNIHMENGFLSFINLIDGENMDTVATLKYTLTGETLVIRDTSVTPSVEILYNKIQ